MSELKAYRPRELVMQGRHNEPIYLKSEADKVIAHHKYKRCLAMAKWCDAERDIFNLTPKVTKVEFFARWHKRWLEIATKFKEAK